MGRRLMVVPLVPRMVEKEGGGVNGGPDMRRGIIVRPVYRLVLGGHGPVPGHTIIPRFIVGPSFTPPSSSP